MCYVWILPKVDTHHWLRFSAHRCRCAGCVGLIEERGCCAPCSQVGKGDVIIYIHIYTHAAKPVRTGTHL